MPGDVRKERAEFEQANASNGRTLERLIRAHLDAYDAALTELEEGHRFVADETDLELDAKTRQAAMWLVTGRCVGLARASHDLVSTGYTFEAVPVLRSLHEAARLLSLLGHRGEDAIVERWLKGRHVGRGDIMAAVRR
jgi:hypothetical protein